MGNLGLAEMQIALASRFASFDLESSPHRSAFQWGGTIFALFLLLMNRLGRRSHAQTNLLVLYLFTSFPTVLFELLRGQFGCWVAFLAVASNLFFPETIPVSRFILFVITPDWLADRLRDDILAEMKSMGEYTLFLKLAYSSKLGKKFSNNCVVSFSCLILLCISLLGNGTCFLKKENEILRQSSKFLSQESLKLDAVDKWLQKFHL
ncbi:cold regulated membrane protein [Corchorus olitorius]|uniref:Cold regulated membrane protein n=1 Tax=Corchorus olitorius TaxID=93759 RepID=A0A1R3INV2_9ROSI|nr:cold regulated membrane protein [Corchorus olitorius]